MTLKDVYDYHRRHQSLAERRMLDGRTSAHSRSVYENEADLHRMLADIVGVAMRAQRPKPSLLDIPS